MCLFFRNNSRSLFYFSLTKNLSASGSKPWNAIGSFVMQMLSILNEYENHRNTASAGRYRDRPGLEAPAQRQESGRLGDSREQPVDVDERRHAGGGTDPKRS